MDIYQYLEECDETIFIPEAGIIITRLVCTPCYVYFSRCQDNEEGFKNAEARISQMDPTGTIEEAAVSALKEKMGETEVLICNTEKGPILLSFIENLPKPQYVR